MTTPRNWSVVIDYVPDQGWEVALSGDNIDPPVVWESTDIRITLARLAEYIAAEAHKV